MPIGRLLGIPFKNTLKYGARNNNIPCLIDCLFWGQTVDSDSYNSRLVNDNEYEAVPSKANSIYFNGTTSKASITFSNDVLMYLDQVVDKYSNDGLILEVWQTGDVAVSGLFQIDIENRTLEIGFDGTTFKEHYQTHFIGKYYNEIDYVTFIDYTFSEGLENKCYDATPIQIIELYKDRLFPFGGVKQNIGLPQNLRV